MHVPTELCHFEEVLQPTTLLVIKTPGKNKKINCIKCNRRCKWRKKFEPKIKKEII
jgi:hypothetical protein